ncbi:hypothetical protein [Nocardia gipuzkoensis]|uniref:hypothetical protein n=1 Tax=Nocardia gipuzkoensis TaxID=2749991 RepID=UPI00237E3060|nr:hypothetical protein [Nocardia gipuzkoensis]MDE1673857.1 hypothetical protein [Nocardia gipuzkoensis]
MTEFGVVKGKLARFTLVDSCGLPIAGPRSRVVTKGFVTVTASPQMREREELEQTNADGGVCVADTTDPERKYWNVSINLCKVNTCLYNMLTGWEVVTGWDGKDIGFSDRKSVPQDRGVAIEVWTGVGTDDECEEPDDDSIFAGAIAGVSKYGYLLLPAVKGWGLGADLEIGAQVSTFTLSGRTAAGTRWGRGPYNVVATDADNTAGRMLAPIKRDQHLRMFETTIAPPEPASDCCPLVVPTPYFGESAIAVADEQPECGAIASNEVQTVTITGSPTGGTWTLTFQGSTTTAIAHNAAAAAVQSALQALSTIGTGNATVTGSASGPYTVTFTGDLAQLNLPLMTAADALTGGTSPEVTVAETQAGGVYA